MQVGAPSGFEAQFQEFVFYAGPVLQLLYWAVMIVAALWAVVLLKKWIDFQMGTGADSSEDSAKTVADSFDGGSDKEDEKVDVDKFVE